jgi:SNF2 family DNA or RNA helicase
VTNNILEAVENKKVELECEKKKKFKEGTKSKFEQDDKIKKLDKCIQRLETRYGSIKDKIYNLNDQYCPVCMDEFNNPTLVNCCQNVYCFECITLASSKNGQCPYCRKKIYKEDLHVISSKSIKKNDQIEKKEKLDVLIELILDSPEGKFLVFANFPQTFEKIKTAFKEKNISYKILKGTTGLVQNTIEDFKNGKFKVIMLNAKFFGAGMNLQMATHIVIYHRFDSDTEEQVIGRAQRLGRTESLNVFYLIHDNETSAFDSKDKFEELDYNHWLELEDDQ